MREDLRVGSVVVNGVRLAYEVSGGGDPVLLIAGTGMPASAWELHGAPALRDAAYRVITFDNRGTGDSDGPPGPYTVEQLATDVIELLDRLGVARVTFCGLSLGGAVGMWLVWALQTRGASRRSFRPGVLLPLVGMGALGYVGQSFSYFTALGIISASATGLLLYTYPTLVTLLAWFFFRERLTPR